MSLHALVLNGYFSQRTIQTGIGNVEINCLRSEKVLATTEYALIVRLKRSKSFLPCELLPSRLSFPAYFHEAIWVGKGPVELLLKKYILSLTTISRLK
ncbi:MAG: hypothetical protein ACTS73_04895 [Arsenophonus sp. NEOnobi-MAG3]